MPIRPNGGLNSPFLVCALRGLVSPCLCLWMRESGAEVLRARGFFSWMKGFASTAALAGGCALPQSANSEVRNVLPIGKDASTGDQANLIGPLRSAAAKMAALVIDRQVRALAIYGDL
jgi:hypothetical protein